MTVKMRYEWRDEQLWDTQEGCWIAWKCLGAYTFFPEDLKKRILRLLNAENDLLIALKRLSMYARHGAEYISDCYGQEEAEALHNLLTSADLADAAIAKAEGRD